MKSVVLIGDSNYLKRLINNNENKIVCDEIVMNSYIEKSSIYRHLKYFQTALRGFFRNGDYDYVIIWQQYIAIYYILLQKIFSFSRKKNYIFIYYILYKKVPNKSILNYFKEFIFLNIINDKRVCKTIFFSKSDYLYQKTDNSKRIAVDYSIELSPEEDFANNSENIEQGFNPYFFSGGTSNRDYEKITSAFSLINEQIIICCTPSNIKNRTIPNNVRVFYDKFGKDFSKLLLNAKALILSFEDRNTVSGQLVILEALRYGKMIIIEDCSMISEGIWNIREKSFVKIFNSKESLIEIINDFSINNNSQIFFPEAREYYYEIIRNNNIIEPVLNEIS